MNVEIYNIAKEFFKEYDLSNQSWYKNICIINSSDRDNQFGAEAYLVIYANPIKEARKILPRSYKNIFIETRPLLYSEN